MKTRKKHQTKSESCLALFFKYNNTFSHSPIIFKSIGLLKNLIKLMLIIYSYRRMKFHYTHTGNFDQLDLSSFFASTVNEALPFNSI